MKLTFIFLVSLILPLSAQYQLENAFPHISIPNPTDIQAPDDGTNRLFGINQEGKIYVFENRGDVTERKLFLDITAKVSFGGERGLLGLAFHPNFSSNGYFYLNYTAPNPLRTIIARYEVSANDPDQADAGSELILLEYDQPYSNHNGGQIAFGPDNFLYIAAGDGGSSGDPLNSGQDKSTLLGNIMRIDVDNSSGGLNYAIPNDNPYYNNNDGYREEIFANGLRNPWRFSFDQETGWLWCADVGQGDWEEIDIIENGGNYGWRIMEGTHCYNPPSGCDTTGLEMPIWEYNHNAQGGVSITGGYVYRGTGLPGLFGKYIYADYGSQRFWALSYDGNSQPQNEVIIDQGNIIPTTFGTDHKNNLYVVNYITGKIYRIITIPESPLPILPGPDQRNVPVNVELRWDTVYSADTYNVQLSSDDSFGALIVDESLADTQYSVLGLDELTTYYWRLNASNEVGTSPYSDAASFTTLLFAPSNLSANPAAANGIELTWNDNSGKEENFVIERKEGDSTSTNPYTVIAQPGSDIVSYVDSSPLADSSFYTYRLRAASGSDSSAYSNSVSVLNTVSSVNGEYLPRKYKLEQNYPNPFNPSTSIRYQLPEMSKIRLTVVNILGETVSILLDEVKEAGYYETEFSARDLPSGIYFLSLDAASLTGGNEYRMLRKMLLLK